MIDLEKQNLKYFEKLQIQKIRISELEKDIKNLLIEKGKDKSEIDELKYILSKKVKIEPLQQKEIHIMAKRDSLVKTLHNQTTKQQKIIDNLRKQISELIYKLNFK